MKIMEIGSFVRKNTKRIRKIESVVQSKKRIKILYNKRLKN